MLVPSPSNVTILGLRCFNRLVSYLPHTANAQRTGRRDLRVGTFSGKGRRRRGKGTVLAPRRDGKSSPFLGGGGGLVFCFDKLSPKVCARLAAI